MIAMEERNELIILNLMGGMQKPIQLMNFMDVFFMGVQNATITQLLTHSRMN
jgi:hypothetical protein